MFSLSSVKSAVSHPVSLIALVTLTLASVFSSAAIAQQAPASTEQASCPALPDTDIPVDNLLQAKVAGSLDSGRLKAGKSFWTNSTRGIAFPDCTIEADGAIYGTINVATKQPGELSFTMDHADCSAKGKRALKFYVVGILAPQGDSSKPKQAPPTTIKPGAVVGLKDITFEPQGGPNCSARITTAAKPSVLLPSGSILLLGVAQ